jgi:hypothetical protein
MKCVRIYADPDGESHFADVDIPLNPVRLFPDQPSLLISAQYRARHVQFVTVPAEMRESGWHSPRERVLAIWLTGEQEFETSDGEIRRIAPGSAVLAEDTWGKGHNTRHPVGEQQVVLIPLPDGR